jgi:DNA-binding NarL/FixJ family response regulator
VLIVEDHDALRASLDDWLKTIIPGVSVLCAVSVEEALETLAHAVADVVLMDIGLPGMNGIEGTRRLHDRAPALPVVMLSIFDDRAHVDEAMEAGAVAFVSKRRMRSELPGVLQGVLERQAAVKSVSTER